MKPIPYASKDAMNISLKNDDTGEIYKGEFIDMRLQMNTIPEGKFAYNCRHDDDGNWVDPVTIEKGGVMVNFAGVLIVENEIEFPEDKNYIPVTVMGWKEET